MNIRNQLIELNACHEGVEWASQYDDPQVMWDACERGDWMLWLAGKYSGEPWSYGRKTLVSASCECARLVWDKMPQPGRDCIELLERWASGEDVARGELIEARRAAYASAAAAAAAAAYASAAAAAAADAVAAASAFAAASADAVAARTKTLGKCAVIVRRHYPQCPLGRELIGGAV